MNPPRHYQRFTIELEGFVIHRDDLPVQMVYDAPQLPWRACVRGGRQMEWQWCATEQEAIAWIESWKANLQPIADVSEGVNAPIL